MTRARSLLAIYGRHAGSIASRRVNETIAKCIEVLNATPEVEATNSVQDDLNEILERIGCEHRTWLVGLWTQYDISQEPITDFDGKIMAEPLFWFERDGAKVACFGDDLLSTDECQLLSVNAIGILKVGADVADSGISE